MSVAEKYVISSHSQPRKAVVLEAPRSLPWARQDTWILLITVLVLAFTRFINLSSRTASGTPIFDEKHYVPQAFDMVKSNFNLLIGGIELNPGYGLVVHPPLAKQIIAIGEYFFGYSPLGWRLMAAICGIITVLLMMLLARALSQSRLPMVFVGIMGVCDGVLLITSRFGMLDIFQVMFIVAVAVCAVMDHRQMHARIHKAFLSVGSWESDYGPRFGFRWWRFTQGIMLGCTLAVKWSGLYYIAFFGLLSVALDWYLRRKYQVKKPLRGSLLADVPPALASLVLLPVAVYAWSWRAWFSSETAVYRHALEQGSVTGWKSHLPDVVANWFYYHSSVLKFHESLTNSNDHYHPWESKPWAWLAAVRPILYSSSSGKCFGDQDCTSVVYLFGTPAIWWLTVPVIFWALYSAVIRRQDRYIIPLVAWGAGWLPWFANFDRQMYFFYAAAIIPFTIIMLAFACQDFWNKGRAFSPRIGSFSLNTGLKTGSFIVCLYLALVIAMFIYWLPIFYGIMIPKGWYDQIMWLPSWR